MNTGERIKKLRKLKKLTLEQVGNYVGVGKSTVRKWENGIIENMGIDKVTKLSEILDVDPHYLMGWNSQINERQVNEMAREKALTAEEVEEEIETLRHSEYVRLARAEQRMKYKRRQALYTLRCLEKRGKELSELGLTINDFDDED